MSKNIYKKYYNIIIIIINKIVYIIIYNVNRILYYIILSLFLFSTLCSPVQSFNLNKNNYVNPISVAAVSPEYYFQIQQAENPLIKKNLVLKSDFYNKKANFQDQNLLIKKNLVSNLKKNQFKSHNLSNNCQFNYRKLTTLSDSSANLAENKIIDTVFISTIANTMDIKVFGIALVITLFCKAKTSLARKTKKKQQF